MNSRRLPGSRGVTLHVLADAPAHATAPPVLLVHGLASNARLWDGVAPRLAALGHPVAALDQRGHGLSDKPDGGYDFATVTDDLVSVIEALGWDRPLVVGQSWGGNVVLELGARHPERVRGVAGIDGGTLELASRFPSWDECARALSPPVLVGRPAVDVEAMLRSMHLGWPETGIAGAMACFEVRADGTVAPWLTLDRHLQILRALWEERPSTVYPGIEVPVLLVPADSGDAEWTAGKRASIAEAEAAIPTVRVAWMSGDHDLHAQHPDKVAELLHDCCEDGFFA